MADQKREMGIPKAVVDPPSCVEKGKAAATAVVAREMKSNTVEVLPVPS